MRKVLPAATVAAALLGAGTAHAASPSHEYVVVLKRDASVEHATRVIKHSGGEVVRVNRAIKVITVRARPAFSSRVSRSAGVVGTTRNARIGRAPQDARKRDAVETDTGSRSANIGRAVPGTEPLAPLQWDMRLIHATPFGSYARQRGSKAVRVGVIDTGIDASHPDIAPNFDRSLSRNFTVDDPTIDGPCEEEADRSCQDPATVDEDGHGTHVASTIGSPINGQGIAGVAPQVDLVNLRAGQDSGYFFLGPSLDALTYAGDHGIDVVNMSYYIDPWLFNCTSNPADSPAEQREQRLVITATQRAIDYARVHGVTTIAAEGNGNSDLGNPQVDDTSPDYPVDENGDPTDARERTIDNGCLSEPTEADGVIGVTSVGPSTRKAYYSDYGVERADVAAPGGDSRDTPDGSRNVQNTILAAYPYTVGITEDREGDGKPDIDPVTGEPTSPAVVKQGDAYYQWIQGTSMASPHAAGVAALIVAEKGKRDRVNGGLTLNPDRVERILKRTATDHPCPAQNPFTYLGLPSDYDATCVGTRAFNGFYGEGIVDANAAVGGRNR